MKTLLRIIIIFLATTLFWIITGNLSFGNGSSSDYTEEIVGVWEPITSDIAPIEFTEFDTVIIDFNGISTKWEYNLRKTKLNLSSSLFGTNNCEITINTEGTETYLEIRGIAYLAGKYKKANNTQLDKAKKASNKTANTASGSKSQTTQSTHKAVQSQQSSKAKPKISNSTDVDIIGKWKPIEGANDPIEFTKYGTAIITMYDGNYLDRKEYKINGNSIKIAYEDATVTISSDQANVYLEIYGSVTYSGKYRKIKQ